jgi:hypothetical protein
MKGWGGPREARKIINDSRQTYLDRHAAANQEAPVNGRPEAVNAVD